VSAKHGERWIAPLVCACALLIPAALAIPGAAAQAPAPAGDVVFELNAADTKVNFTLSATMHTVHGSFRAARGRAQYAGATGAVQGEFVVDATSGETGDTGRDKNMHKDVLESAKYGTISFRPDRVEGRVSNTGVSEIQVHGTLNLHGADHELTIPAKVQVDGGKWTATAKFSVPYVDWGMKNPSTFLLKVGKSVDVEVAAAGMAK
jgi:polyisoprenoid-binding protein YceI